MFFSWFKENKQFKKRSGLSGQITPFLLVALVILLIAAIATINIGKVSLDKTCSANAADAGALAAASGWATALNNLAQANANMEDSFDTNYATYQAMYNLADGYLNEAITYALAASAAATAAAMVLRSADKQCDQPWYFTLEVAALLDAAALSEEQASKALLSFNLCAQYLKSYTDSFQESQWKSFCNNVVSMDSAYENAYNSGFTYAFSNSYISAKLSDTQNDDFNLWMSSFTTKSGDTSDIDNWIVAQPAYDKVYNWTDKALQQHTVSATLDLPKITSYEVQHTTGSYSKISDLLDDAIDWSSTIGGVFNSTAITLGSIGALFTLLFALSVIQTALAKIGDAGIPYYSAICRAIAKVLCAAQQVSEKADAYSEDVVTAILAAIVSAGGAATSLYTVRDRNDEAYDDWYPDGAQSIANCQDCKPCRNDTDTDLLTCTPCQAASDLMIVRITEVVFPSWVVKCATTQIHPGTSSGIMATSYPAAGITSSSTASFSGGDVGNFEYTYDAKITEVE